MQQTSLPSLSFKRITLKGQCHEKSFQTETVSSVHSPFNLLRSFKDDVY